MLCVSNANKCFWFWFKYTVHCIQIVISWEQNISCRCYFGVMGRYKLNPAVMLIHSTKCSWRIFSLVRLKAWLPLRWSDWLTSGFEQPPPQSPGRAGPLHRTPTQTLDPAHSPPLNGTDHSTPLLSSECPELLRVLWRGGGRRQQIYDHNKNRSTYEAHGERRCKCTDFSFIKLQAH